jgi:hypothetical protein
MPSSSLSPSYRNGFAHELTCTILLPVPLTPCCPAKNYHTAVTLHCMNRLNRATLTRLFSFCYAPHLYSTCSLLSSNTASLSRSLGPIAQHIANRDHAWRLSHRPG